MEHLYIAFAASCVAAYLIGFCHGMLRGMK